MPIDMGQYNTINLQKELAESMREILAEEVKGEEPSEILEREAGQPSLEKGMEAPAELADEVAEIVDETDTEPESEYYRPNAAQPATEEVFFEEDVKDILLDIFGEIRHIFPKAFLFLFLLHFRQRLFRKFLPFRR